MRFTFMVAVLVTAAACSPRIPDSAAGVGFGDYDQYQTRQQTREAALAGAVAVPPAGAVSDETTTPPPATAGFATSTSTPVATAVAVAPASRPAAPADSAELAAETEAALAATRANSGQVPLQADPNNPPPQTVTTSTGISEENDFQAVGAVRSIETDAELLARNRQQYQVVQPTALPSRKAATGPNIVEYALKTSQPVGAKIYTRIGINKQARFARNCAKYASDDLAQIDFLAKGGPKRDKLGLDPDGDGFACNWSPEPFRKAVSG